MEGRAPRVRARPAERGQARALAGRAERAERGTRGRAGVEGPLRRGDVRGAPDAVQAPRALPRAGRQLGVAAGGARAPGSGAPATPEPVRLHGDGQRAGAPRRLRGHARRRVEDLARLGAREPRGLRSRAGVDARAVGRRAELRAARAAPRSALPRDPPRSAAPRPRAARRALAARRAPSALAGGLRSPARGARAARALDLRGRLVAALVREP